MTVSEPPHNSRVPQAQQDVEDPEEEVRRLRQQERVSWQETEESRAKKARILSTPTLDFKLFCSSGTLFARCRGDFVCRVSFAPQ